MLSLVCAAVLGQASLDAKLDYAPECARLEVILRDLSNRLGTKIACSNDLKGELIAAAVKDVTGRELLNHIADCMNATASFAAGEVSISQTNEQRKESEAQELSARAARIRKALAVKLEPFGQKEAEDLAQKLTANIKRRNSQGADWYTEATKLSKRSPSGRFCSRVLSLISPEEFAGLPVGHSVLAQPNNRMQLPIKADLSKAAAELQTEHQLFREAYQKHDIKEEEGLYLAGERTDPLAPVRKVICRVDDQMFMGLSITILGLSETGVEVQQTFNPDNDALNELLTKPADAGTVVDVNPLTKALLTTAMRSSSGEAFTPDKAVQERLLQMEEIDPMGYGLTDLARTIREKEGLNVVGCLSDEGAAVEFLTSMASRPTVGLAELSLTKLKHTISRKDGWWTLKQTEPKRNRLLRFDRKSMAALLQKASSGKEIRLTDLAELMRQQPLDIRMDVQSMLFLPAFGLGGKAQTLEDPWLRVYAHLPEGFQGSLAVGKMNGAQKEALWAAMAARSTAFQVPGGRSARPNDADLTELLPNGLVPPVVLEVSRTRDQAAVRQKRRAFGRDGQNAQELAYDLLQAEKPEIFGSTFAGEVNALYRMAEREDIRLSVMVSTENGQASSVGQLSDVFGDTGQFVPFAQLPKSFVDDVNAKLKLLREQYKDIQAPPVSGGKKPPPPRG